MLNYNYNIISPLAAAKKGQADGPYITWTYDERTVAVDAPNMDSIAHGVMNILASSSNCINVTYDAADFFQSDANAIVTASVQGTGQWPTTGSVTMSLFLAGIPRNPLETPIYFNPILEVGATQGNMNLSGSALIQPFQSPYYYDWYIDGKIVHKKGNQYNPLIKWKSNNQSPVSTTVPINGYTASFNIRKDANVSLVSIPNASGSNSGEFYNDYAFNVTASYTASINNVTGSTTMSFSIPEAGISTYKTFYNPTTTIATLTGSFSASKNSTYGVTASVTFNKGNISNSDINWQTSGSTYVTTSAQYSLVKDANVNMRDNYNLLTGSVSASFKNDYAFNITASLSGSKNWAYSSSFQALTMSISIPEIGYYITSSHTASIITASFEAQTDISAYNITTSIELEPYPSYSLAEYVFIGKGGSGGGGGIDRAGGGGGAGAVVSGSNIIIQPNSIYTVEINNNNQYTGSAFITGSQILVKAPNGGDGANSAGGYDGGSGGGGSYAAKQYEHNPGGHTIPATGSGDWFANITGSNGGRGSYFVSLTPIPGYPFGIGGGGGGASGSGVDSNDYGCSGGFAGGPGVSNLMLTYLTGQTGSFAYGGKSGAAPHGCSGGPYVAGANGLTWGAGGDGTNAGTIGGDGYSGIGVIKYLGTQKGRGGTVTYDGTYTYHTFTASGLFYSTANLIPKMH